MKKALLPALVAALFTTNCAIAADRELLFGPEKVNSTSHERVKKSSQKAKNEVTPSTPKRVMRENSEPKFVVKDSPVRVPEAKKPSGPTAKEIRDARFAAKESSKPKIGLVKAIPELKQEIQQYQSSSPEPVASIEQARGSAAPYIEQDERSDRYFMEQRREVKARRNAMAPGSDSFSERADLANKYTESLSIGFFPASSSNQDSFSFLQNYLPLANFLSVKTGFLITLVKDGSGESISRSIQEGKYPMIFVSASNIDDAIRGGYYPIISGVDNSSASVIVSSSSRAERVEDIQDMKVGWIKRSPATILAKFDLSKAGISSKNKYIDLPGNDISISIRSSKEGDIDAWIANSIEAREIIAKSGGKLKKIDLAGELPSSGMWIRKDLRDSELSKRISSALLEVSPSTSGKSKIVAEAFLRGFGAIGEFRAADSSDIDDADVVIDEVTRAWPDSYYQGRVDSNVRQANLSAPITTKRSSQKSNDVIGENNEIRSKFSNSYNIGLYPGSNVKDSYGFMANFLPLSSYLSSEAGYSVGLIPEMNANLFAKRIARNEYPAIIIGPSFSMIALSAGYLPASRGGEFVSPAFLVPFNSTIKELKDISGHKIGTTKASDAATVGKWEILKNKIESVDFDYFSKSSEGISILTSGAVDAILIRASEARKIIEDTKVEGKPRFRAIFGNEEVPAVSAWVRNDVYDLDSMQKFISIMSELSKGNSGSLRENAFIGISNGFGTSESWQASGIEEHTTSVEMLEGLIRANQPVVDDVSISAKIVDKARAQEFIQSNPAYHLEKSNFSGAKSMAK